MDLINKLKKTGETEYKEIMARRAYEDEGGNNILSTYLPKSNLKTINGVSLISSGSSATDMQIKEYNIPEIELPAGNSGTLTSEQFQIIQNNDIIKFTTSYLTEVHTTLYKVSLEDSYCFTAFEPSGIEKFCLYIKVNLDKTYTIGIFDLAENLKIELDTLKLSNSNGAVTIGEGIPLSDLKTAMNLDNVAKTNEPNTFTQIQTFPAEGINVGSVHLTEAGLQTLETESEKIANKVDKIATSNKVYATDNSSAQVGIDYSATNSGNSIAQRKSDGTLTVSTPTAASDATTKAYVDSLLTTVKANAYQVVTELPQPGEEGILYLVSAGEGVYEKQIWEGSQYVNLGTTNIDLSNYVQGSSLVSDKIILGNTGNSIKDSGYGIETTLSGSTTAIPSSAAVKTVTDSKYVKPTDGIPKTDLDSNVQASLNKADSALQSVPDATTTQKGISLLGASGGAARYGIKADVGLSNIVNAVQTATPSASSNSYFTAGGAYTLQQTLQNYTNSAINTVKSESYQVVSSLPQTGAVGVMYLVPISGSENNYRKYIWENNKFISLGATSFLTINLDGDLSELTSNLLSMKRFDLWLINAGSVTEGNKIFNSIDTITNLPAPAIIRASISALNKTIDIVGIPYVTDNAWGYTSYYVGYITSAYIIEIGLNVYINGNNDTVDLHATGQARTPAALETMNNVLESGITATKVSAYDGYSTSKQDKLTAGTGISITDNTISCTVSSPITATDVVIDLQ